MAGTNKKKKKPAANPARGFATTSTQSKAKLDIVKDADSTDASGAVTPHTPQDSTVPDEGKVEPSTAHSEPELHKLSPEELEAQLELSELQQFVEKHAAKVRKDASRHVSRLQTDKRLLRGQADFLSVKDWLPDELMQQILEFATTDLQQEDYSGKDPLPPGDDLVAKVWSLRIVLLELDMEPHRANEAIRFLLQNPPSEDLTGQVWGFTEALEWLSINCASDELLGYDSQKRRPATNFASDESDVENVKDGDNGTESPKQHDSPISESGKGAHEASTHDDFDVSDIESDLEPDELLSVYLRTKARLYDVNPAEEEVPTKKPKKSKKDGDWPNRIQSKAELKLQQRLRKIERDALFDQQEADERWALKRVELAREAAERKQLQLLEHPDLGTKTVMAKSDGTLSGDVVDLAGKLGNDVLQEAEEMDDDEILGGMFDALPGVSDERTSEQDGQEAPENVTIRDFGKVAGMSPRKILEEVCRSRDSRCKIFFKQVSPTTYVCRHAVVIDWTKEQEVLEAAFLPSVAVDSKPRRLSVRMMREATRDVSQSEAYVATAALFLISFGSPKEEKSHMKLPSAYRDLWNEISELKREFIDAADRQTVKELRSFIEESVTNEDADDEVVFNANSRRLNGATSGTVTPASRPQTPKSVGPDISQILKDTWARKASAPSYQRMLLARMNLPMFHAKATALDTISRNQVTIVVGDTGSGKSTQLPQFLLEHELSNGRRCKIYCTEPRRISAISLAQRVSEELGERKGDLGTARSLVGYAIRLESQTSPHTRLVYATVGIVLRMLESADGLNDITHLVLDEVHERSIDTDFLLIVLQTLLKKRPDLKVVLMSATLDAQKFSRYLNGAPIISVPGRTFPVQPKFLEDALELTGHTNADAPVEEDEGDDEPESESQTEGGAAEQLKGYSKRTIDTLASYDEYRIDHALIVKLLEKIASHPEYQQFSKAVLVFLPGIAEIRHLHDILLSHPSFARDWTIHALHSTFSSEDQQAAFEIPPNGIRKIVLATNIAETGITIPDVTCVIDTGKHREMRFDERRQMSRLIQSFIARTNAKQRRGRAGRVQEGICFHLFTKHRFEKLMIEQQTPEMLRLSLQDLVMRVKICKLGDIETALSQALDPPSSKNIRRAIDALVGVGALTDNEQLTPLGSQLAKLALDAQLGKLLLYGAIFGCLDFALTVAATLSSKSPFLSPMHAKKQADSVRLGFKKGDSDLLTVYNAYIAWRNICITRGLSEFHFCNKNFLSAQNLANIEELKGQLLVSLADAAFVYLSPQERSAAMRVRPGSRQRSFVVIPEKYVRAADNDVAASSVVAWSFYPKIIKREGKGWRNIANNQSLGLHPTSVNKTVISPEIKYLSYYSIMQSSSRFTNAQETTPITDFALVLLAGDAVFHMYAGVIVVDSNRLKLKVRDWKTMIALKILRLKLKEALGRSLKYPGKELGDRQRRWMELVEEMLEQQRKT